MQITISSTPVFRKQLDRLCRKYPSLINDVAILIKSLAVKPIQGKPLGQNLYKIRLAVASKGSGKSGGTRVITCVKLVDNKITLVTMYDKSEQDTMTIKELLKLLNA